MGHDFAIDPRAADARRGICRRNIKTASELSSETVSQATFPGLETFSLSPNLPLL